MVKEAGQVVLRHILTTKAGQGLQQCSEQIRHRREGNLHGL